MPNNSTLPATGDVIAAEEIAGAKIQRVKLVLGAYGEDDGDAGASAPLPVQASALPLPAGASTEATLAALNVIAAAIRSAVDAINGKATAINTGAIAGTVALDAPTLAALESITASTGGLTNAELRGAAVPVAGTVALDAPTLAALETITASTGGLTDAQLRAADVPTALRSLHYPVSTGNNTTDQLAANTSFIGGIETVQNLQAAQIQVVCDQPYTLTINQYIDAAGESLTESTTIVRAAGQPLCQNVLLPGNYFNLVLTNTGITDTTKLHIDTTFGIMDTLPKTLGQKLRDESMGVTLSSDDIDLLNDIRNALAPLMSARGTDGTLRMSVTGGSLSSAGAVSTVTTVTTVNTVSNVANQTAIGGLQAVNHIPSLMNIAAQANISNMLG